MKRLIAKVNEPLFQICQCFRAGERGRKHLEEFTMLEWYRVDSDYFELMEDCQSLVCHVLQDLSSDEVNRRMLSGSCFGTMPVAEQWQRISVRQAFTTWSPVPLEKALSEDRFDEIIVDCIEPRLGLELPTFLYDYPSECASLARLKEGDGRVAERFELYISTMELANGFTELTDALEQRNRFFDERNRQLDRGITPMPFPDRFLADLALLDSVAGIAFGVDRFLMLLMSAPTIDEVVSISPGDWE